MSPITKRGGTIAGNITKIVMVRTDPGYASNPGLACTATTVGTYC